jgi:enterochelin esterase-like enzyme
MKKTSRNSISTAIIILLFFSVNVFCNGEIRHYLLPESKVASEKTLSVYLPEDYSTSGVAYPVLYLLHGVGGDNLTFLGGGYGGLMSNANVSVIAEGLSQKKKITPFIVVCPDLSGVGNYDKYLIRDVVPFVDATLRTIPSREFRAVGGHSIGGYRSLHLALAHPDVFSIVGGFSSYLGMYRMELDRLLNEYNQKSYPILFWLSAGRQDEAGVTQSNREFAELLQVKTMPTTYVEDDGDHTNEVAERLGEFLEYFSKWVKR